MPRVEMVQVSTYVYPWIANALKEAADAMGTSQSRLVEQLIRWGVRAMWFEAMRQGISLPLEELHLRMVSNALEYDWGKISPSLSDVQEEQAAYRALIASMRADTPEPANAGAMPEAPDALAEAVRRVIADMKQKGEL